MARAKRKGAKSEEPDGPTSVTTLSASMSRSNSPHQSQTQESSSQLRDETCPACVLGETESLNSFEKERWVRCDACRTWYHWRCVGQGEDIDSIDKWCADISRLPFPTLNNAGLGFARSASTKNRLAPSHAKLPHANPLARGPSAIMPILTLGLVSTLHDGLKYWRKKRQKGIHSGVCMGVT